MTFNRALGTIEQAAMSLGAKESINYWHTLYYKSLSTEIGM